MAESISWVATVATVIAAFLTAANLGSRVTGLGFCVFLVGSLCWLTVGMATGQSALTWTNIVLTVLNVFGIWRWLGRQANVEQGAYAASEASEHTSGESLFPISLLSAAPVLNGGKTQGHCIGAMAGSSSGRVHYVVVSEGGVAGVGETLRRLPFPDAQVEGETLVTKVAFDSLEPLPRDQWPAR